MENFETVSLFKLRETMLHNTYLGTWNFKTVHAYLNEGASPLIFFTNIIAITDLPISPQSTFKLTYFTHVFKLNYNSNRFCSFNF